MKIYEIGTGYTPIPATIGAATELVVEELTRAFLKNGEDAEIIDICSNDRKEFDLPLTEVRVPSFFAKKDVSLGIVHKLKRVVYSMALAQKLKKLLKQSKEKVVLHFHNQYNAYFFYKLVPKKYRKKALVAYTVHSYIWNGEWENIEQTVKKRYFQEISAVKNCDVVFVLNDITREHFEKHIKIDKSKCFVVTNGVNAEKYKPFGVAKAELLENNGLRGKRVVFQVGSVCERKNQLETVKMLGSYLKEHTDVVYWYAGGIIEPEYKQKIDDYSKANGIEEQVVYAGELSPGEQLNRYYNMASCCVFTSTQEAFSLVITEAIVAGAPVVLAENLAFDAKNCYRVYKSKDEFVSLVDDIVCNGNAAWFDTKDVFEKYTWNTVSKTYTHVFKSITQ